MSENPTMFEKPLSEQRRKEIGAELASLTIEIALFDRDEKARRKAANQALEAMFRRQAELAAALHTGRERVDSQTQMFADDETAS